jgi:hypothetical protein
MGGTRAIQLYVGPYAEVTIPLDRVQLFHETNEKLWASDISCVLNKVKHGRKEFMRTSILPPGSPTTKPKRQTYWGSYQGDGDSEEIVAITAEEVRAEVEWFEREYAEYLRTLTDVCGKRAQVLWGVVPKVDF